MNSLQRFVAAILPLVACGCGRSEPPGADAEASASIAPLPGSLASLPPAAPAAASADAAGAGAAARDAGAAVAAASAAASASASASAANGEDPGKLPQTPDKPQTSGTDWDAHVASLWDAIVNDDPDRALGFFFPVGAYEQVKDIANAAADWKSRLWRNFARDVHQLHARLGANAASAKFVRIDVPEERASWVRPHEEGNKGSYWRVYGTQLHYEDDGHERAFDVKSLISWRGEWYVVHLSGFK
jgi:hypothetical protein